jgi:hypothetical protein
VMTTLLRIEHPVGDFERWRLAFDSDPVGRERGGVQRYRIMRGGDDPSYVLVDLEFDERTAAEQFLELCRSELHDTLRCVLERWPERRLGLHVQHQVDEAKYVDDFGVAMCCGFGRPPDEDGMDTMREHRRVVEEILGAIHTG